MLTRDAVQLFGGKSKLAQALGISAAAVSQWGRFPPVLRQYQLHALSGGRLLVTGQSEGSVQALSGIDSR